MPTYTSGPYDVDLYHEATILDTNVICACFDKNDPYHDSASEYVEILASEGTIIVPVVVLVEAWGMLVGKDGNWRSGFALLNWLSNPGGPTLLLNDTEQFDEIRKVMMDLHVDCVDSFLYHLAHQISYRCKFKPPIRVATYDTRDVYKFMGIGTMRFRVFDMRSGDHIEI